MFLCNIYHYGSLTHRPQFTKGERIIAFQQAPEEQEKMLQALQKARCSMCYSDQLTKKGLFYKLHAQAYKAGYEIFLKNFLTGNSQNNRKKIFKTGRHKTEARVGREKRTILFLPTQRVRERGAEFSPWQAAQGCPINSTFHRQEVFWKRIGKLENSVSFLLRWSSLGWAEEEE